MMNEPLTDLARAVPSASPSLGARERVWTGLRGRERRRARQWWLGASMGIVAIAVAFVALRPRSQFSVDPRVLSVRGQVAVVAGGEPVARVEEFSLGDGAWVETSQGQALVGTMGDFLVWALEDTRFQVEHVDDDVWVYLDRGEINVWSAPRSSSALWVATPRHRVAVVGTMFSVETLQGERIAVARGTVDLYRDDERFARLSAGESWAAGIEPAGVPTETVAVMERLASGEMRSLPSPLAPASAKPSPAPAVETGATGSERRVTVPPSAPRPASKPIVRTASRQPPPPPAVTPAAPQPSAQPSVEQPEESPQERLVREAESLERSGDFGAAASRYEALARGRGLDAEWALYRLGTLRQHKLRDSEGALRAWREHRRRFRNGSLRQETDLSIIETLVRLKRHREAFARAESFLAEYPESERRAEMERLKERLRSANE